MEYWRMARPVDNIMAMIKKAATNAVEVLNYHTVNQVPCKKQLNAKRYPIDPKMRSLFRDGTQLHGSAW